MKVEGTYRREDMTLAPRDPFTSDRLMYKPMTVEDEPELYAMQSDERVMRFIPRPVATDRNTTRQKNLDDFAAGERYKFIFGVFWKKPKDNQSDRMIGIIIMRPMEDGRSVEIGYWLMPDVWGLGLATEACHALIDHCPEPMGFERSDITALVTVGNHASRNVLEKAGLYVTHTEPEDTHQVWCFEMKPESPT